MKRNDRWHLLYEATKDYVVEHHQLPDKHKVENRALLNWWKYNMKKARLGKLSEEKMALLQKISELREVRKPDLFSF